MARGVCDNNDRALQDDASIEQVTQQLVDCTGDDMIYVVAWHNECDSGTDDMRGTVSTANENRTMGATSAMTCDNSGEHVNSTHTQTMKVRKRRARKPATSALSEKVWQEMRRHIAGRDQHDGVT